MASAWGLSWGAAWGAAWGSIAAFAWVKSPTRVSNPLVVMTQHDTAPPMEQQLLGADGTPQVLPPGCTVKFTMRKPDGTPGVLAADCEIVAYATGAIRYWWGATDLDTAGTCDGTIEVDYPVPGGKKETFPNGTRIRITIIPDLD